jgi:hypothetical protein
MKRFMFLSIGVLCLAIAALIGFNVGSQQAKAQSSEIVSVYCDNQGYSVAFLTNGDAYVRRLIVGTDCSYWSFDPACYAGNYWSHSDTISTNKSTWSGVKGQYPK